MSRVVNNTTPEKINAVINELEKLVTDASYDLASLEPHDYEYLADRTTYEIDRRAVNLLDSAIGMIKRARDLVHILPMSDSDIESGRKFIISDLGNTLKIKVRGHKEIITHRTIGEVLEVGSIKARRD